MVLHGLTKGGWGLNQFPPKDNAAPKWPIWPGRIADQPRGSMGGIVGFKGTRRRRVGNELIRPASNATPPECQYGPTEFPTNPMISRGAGGVGGFKATRRRGVVIYSTLAHQQCGAKMANLARQNFGPVPRFLGGVDGFIGETAPTAVAIS